MSGALDLFVRSSLLLAMIWLAVAAVRRAGGSAAMRHMVWLLGLSALLLFPFLTALLPPLALPILPRIASPLPATMSASAPAGLSTLLWLLYLTVGAGLLGRIALGRILLARLWQRSCPLPDAHWPGLLEELTDKLAIRRPVSLRIVNGAIMPMTWGTANPRILLPAASLAWTEEHRRNVLLHELAHVARRDSLSRTAAALVCALYWIHPAIWLAFGRMCREQEQACDDLVLSLGTRPSAYARTLLEIAGAFLPMRAAAGLPLAMAGHAELERRLAAIVGRGPRARSNGRFVAASAATALAASLLVAALVPVARAGRAADQDRVSRTSSERPVRAQSPDGRARMASPGRNVAAGRGQREDHDRDAAAPRAVPALPPRPAVSASPSIPATPPTPPMPAAPSVPVVPASLPALMSQGP